jgi:hypothetical protein
MTGFDAVRWWIGWRPKATIVTCVCLGAVMSAANSSAVPLMVLLVLGVCIWVKGTQTVKTHAPRLLAEVEAQCVAAGARKLGMDVAPEQTFLMRGEMRGENDERYTLIPFSTKHKLTVIYVTDAFIGVYAGSSYDLKELQTRLGSTTKEVYYPHVSGVEFCPPIFKLATSSEQMIYPISDNPEVGEAALNAIRAKLRRVHAVA